MKKKVKRRMEMKIPQKMKIMKEKGKRIKRRKKMKMKKIKM